MPRLVILGGGESGVGTAILGKKKGYDVFVSDFGKIKENYREVLIINGIQWEDEQHTEELILNAESTCQQRESLSLFPPSF
jgi:UDP-N-acetylmuramoylalanine--D-glutamate ligase